MRLVYLQNKVPCFQPTDEQVRRFAERVNASGEVRLCRSEEEFLALLPKARAVFVWDFRQEWFARAPLLAHLCTPAAGHDYLGALVPPPGVTVHYGSFHGAIMAETALGAVLSCAHGLLPFAGAMTSGGEAWPYDRVVAGARRVFGSTIVVLGFGAIGRRFGEMAKRLGAKVVGVRRHPAPDAEAADSVVGADRLDEVLPSADHLVCILPSDTGTTGILDARRIALLKPTAFVYNFGRGNAIDEDALAAALAARRVAGAVLDVFREEPLSPGSPLRSAPNAFLYPHSSAFSPDYLDLYFEKVAESIEAAGARG